MQIDTDRQTEPYPETAGVPSLCPQSPVFSAFASLGQSWGLQQSGGLDVDISVFLLRDVPTAYFILTHFASPAPDTCPANSFGQILSPRSDWRKTCWFFGHDRVSVTGSVLDVPVRQYVGRTEAALLCLSIAVWYRSLSLSPADQSISRSVF